MKSKAKLISLIVLIVFSLLLVGCNNSKNENDGEQVVAEINDAKVLKKEVTELYNQQKYYYNITEEMENDPAQKETLAQLKKDILEELISLKLVITNAQEAGYAITDETMKKANESFQQMQNEIKEQMKANSTDQAKKDEDYSKEAQDYINQQLEAVGMTKEDFINRLAEDQIIQLFMEESLKDIAVTDDEIQQYYNEQLDIQKAGMPTYGLGQTIEVFKPTEVRVKHILVALPEEITTKYQELLTGNKTAEAEKLLEENLALLQPEVEEILAKAKNGEDFEKLIQEYGQDPGMNSNPEGYLVRQNGQYVESFEKAAFQLKEGEISGLVGSPFGYHILKAYEIIAEKTYSLDEKKAEIQLLLEQQKKSNEWNSLIEKWRAEAEIKKYEDLL